MLIIPSLKMILPKGWYFPLDAIFPGSRVALAGAIIRMQGELLSSICILYKKEKRKKGLYMVSILDLNYCKMLLHESLSNQFVLHFAA